MNKYRLSYGSSAIGLRHSNNFNNRERVYFDHINEITTSPQAAYWRMLFSILDELYRCYSDTYYAIEITI